MSTALATLGNKFAVRFGMESNGEELLATLKATAFKGQVSDAQMQALLIVADQYGLNPWTKEIYAFPDKNNGIVPVVGVDGWARIINENPQFDGMEFRASEEMIQPEGCQNKAPVWMECVIYRKDRSRPIVVREYLDEVYRKPFKKDNGYQVDGPWQTHTKRFMRHKVMIQCSRLAFGYVGIYDQDEAERIIDSGTVYDGNTGEVLPRKEPSKPQLQSYTDDQLEANIAGFSAAIQSGKKSADEIIAMISTRYQLSGDQIARIRSLQITHTAEAGQEYEHDHA